MNSRKLEYFIGIVATLIVTTGIMLYAINEPARLDTAQATQLQTDLDEAMTLYAENCAVCHGLAGEGIGAMPPLDNAGLSEMDSDTLFKIISRGLYGTAMPAWNKEDGGPLGDYQVSEMVKLIQYGDWAATHDRVVNLGMAPLIPFATEPDAEVLAALADMPGGELLAQGITIYAQQCVACHGADGLGTSLAPPLNDPAVRTMTMDELDRIIRNGVAGTLMAGWESALSEDEITAALTLITQWDQVPAGAIPAPDIDIPVTEQSLALGGDLFTSNCSQCHGPEGQGTQRAPSLNVKGYLADTSDGALEQIITLGVTGTAMPAWGDRMTEVEIQAIVGFIRAWEPTAPEVAEPARTGGGGPWWRTDDSTGGSSGGGKGQGGPPEWAGGSQGGQDSQTHDQPVVTAEGGTVGSPPADAGPPDTAGGGQDHASGQGETAAGQAGGGQGGPPDDHSHDDGEVPPWLQPEEPQSWYQAMDLRAWTMVFAGIILALVLISAAFFGLSRMPSPEIDQGEPTE
ncbi:MAG: c-type cytochrome [Chloroflexi bacterium]|nr:c-type cytochrome [Chloroflexota bacterium]